MEIEKKQPEKNIKQLNISKILNYISSSKSLIKKNGEIKYITNISKILDKLNIKIFESKLEKYPDVKKKVYEGGFKIWECEFDGLKFIYEEKINFENKNILELGCGSGLIGLYCLLKKCNNIFFQDYNKEVLFYHTNINIFLNQDNIQKNINYQFLAESWSNMVYKENLNFYDKENFDLVQKKIDSTFDFIFGGDILYEIENYNDLINLLDKFLSENGKAFFITKMYYYGNGGNLYEFEDYIKKSGIFVSDIVFECNTGSANKRVVLEIKRIENVQETN